MKKAMFSSLDWQWALPGFVLDEFGGISGDMRVSDALGRPTPCLVNLQIGLKTGGREWLAGDICPDSAEGSYAQLELLLQLDAEAQTAWMTVALHEHAPGYSEASVGLAAGTSVVYWVVLALARRLGPDWLLQTEIIDRKSDRVTSQLLGELHLAAEIIADSTDPYACCMPPREMAI
jgi:hypothetical protein